MNERAQDKEIDGEKENDGPSLAEGSVTEMETDKSSYPSSSGADAGPPKGCTGQSRLARPVFRVAVTQKTELNTRHNLALTLTPVI